jgi:hypothetical protein
MKRRVSYLLLIGVSGFLLMGAALGKTYFVQIRYEPMGKISTLQKKVGLTLGLSPFKDTRPDRQHIGRHTKYRGIPAYFDSIPSPLDNAIRESLSESLSRKGLKIVLVSTWDGKQESLKSIEADSVLMIEIERFWIEGRTVPRGINVSESIYLTFRLGLKKEGKVLTQRAYSSKQRVFNQLTSENAELMINQALAEILDSFFSSLR